MKKALFVLAMVGSAAIGAFVGMAFIAERMFRPFDPAR